MVPILNNPMSKPLVHNIRATRVRLIEGMLMQSYTLLQKCLTHHHPKTVKINRIWNKMVAEQRFLQPTCQSKCFQKEASTISVPFKRWPVPNFFQTRKKNETNWMLFHFRLRIKLRCCAPLKLKGVVPSNGFMDLFVMVIPPEKIVEIWHFLCLQCRLFSPLITRSRPATDLHTLTLLRL